MGWFFLLFPSDDGSGLSWIPHLLGNGPDRGRHVQQGQAMKALLVAWLRKVDSPHLEEVRNRAI